MLSMRCTSVMMRAVTAVTADAAVPIVRPVGGGVSALPDLSG